MRKIIMLSLMLCSFTVIAEKQQSPISVNLPSYHNALDNYISTLFITTCELGLQSRIKSNSLLDESTMGLIAQAVEGLEKDTTTYALIHDVVMVGTGIGRTLRDKGKFSPQSESIEMHTCVDIVSNMKQQGIISGVSQELISSEKNTTKNANKNVSNDSVYRTTAEALAAMYDENEVAADDKIGNRKINVSGVVQRIDKNFAGDVVIVLHSSSKFMPVLLRMDDTEKARASKLKKGQETTITCKKMTVMLGAPSGNGCRFD